MELNKHIIDSIFDIFFAYSLKILDLASQVRELHTSVIPS